jgi:hypothetical protein
MAPTPRAPGMRSVGVAIAAGDDHRAAKPLLPRCGGREEVIGLVARTLRLREAACGDEFRQGLQLLDQLVVELAA